jgi:hypothetical protein
MTTMLKCPHCSANNVRMFQPPNHAPWQWHFKCRKCELENCVVIPAMLPGPNDEEKMAQPVLVIPGEFIIRGRSYSLLERLINAGGAWLN